LNDCGGGESGLGFAKGIPQIFENRKSQIFENRCKSLKSWQEEN
jgi:hypothetical protein